MIATTLYSKSKMVISVESIGHSNVNKFLILTALIFQRLNNIKTHLQQSEN